MTATAIIAASSATSSPQINSNIPPLTTLTSSTAATTTTTVATPEITASNTPSDAPTTTDDTPPEITTSNMLSEVPTTAAASSHLTAAAFATPVSCSYISPNLPPFNITPTAPATNTMVATSFRPFVNPNLAPPFPAIPRATAAATTSCPFVSTSPPTFTSITRTTATTVTTNTRATANTAASKPSETVSSHPLLTGPTTTSPRPFISPNLPPFPSVSMSLPPTTASPSEPTTLNPPKPTLTTNITPPSPFVSSNLLPPFQPLPPSYTSHSLIGSIVGHPPGATSSSQTAIYPISIPTPGGSMQNPVTWGADQNHQLASVANPAGYMRSIDDGSVTSVDAVDYGIVQGQMGFGFLNSDHVAPLISTRIQGLPQFSVQSRVPGGATNGHMTPTAYRASAASNPKMSLLLTVPSVPQHNRYQDAREKARDNSVFVVHDREVRFQDCRVQDCPSKSLYTLCRSWVHNSVPQEIQPFFGGGIKLLPRPLPVPSVESTKLEKTEEDEDSKEEMPISSLDDPSEHDLLASHVRHAKKIRANLKEDRLLRIERYKQRLSLLLPPQLESDNNNG